MLVFACPFFLARCPLLTESLKQASFGKQKLLSFTKFSKSLDCRDKNYTSNNVSRQKSQFLSAYSVSDITAPKITTLKNIEVAVKIWTNA